MNSGGWGSPPSSATPSSIPLGYLCGLVLRLSPFVVLLVLRIDYIIKSIWLILRLKSGKWIHQAKRVSG